MGPDADASMSDGVDGRDRFANLFRTDNPAKGQTEVDPETGDKEHWTVTRPASPDDYARHLAGDGPRLGIPMVDPATDTVWFGGIDLDALDADHAARASEVADAGLPLVVCRSTSGALHGYLFLSEPTPAVTVKGRLEEWATGLGWTNPDGRPVEVFPKQTELSAGGVGNWISLPYYGPDGHQRAVTAEGEELDLPAFFDHAEAARVSESELRATYGPQGGDNPFSDGPLCLYRAHARGITEGGRNEALFNCALYWRAKLGTDGPWQEKTREYNEANVDPPLSDGELRTTVFRSLGSDRTYAYRCANCDRDRCDARPYGRIAVIKRAGGLESVGSLRKVTTDPPIYLVEVDGKDVELDAHQFLNFSYFWERVYEVTDVVLPEVDQPVWRETVKKLTDDLTRIEAPETAGVYGQFLSHLRDFLSMRHNANTMDDLEMAVPFEKDGAVYFYGKHLIQYLRRHGFRDYEPERVWTKLAQQGADRARPRVFGLRPEVWTLPADHDLVPAARSAMEGQVDPDGDF